MKRNVKKILRKEYVKSLEKLETLELDSDEYRIVLNHINDLSQINIDNIEDDKHEKINQYLERGIELAGVILPLVFYGVWMKKGLEFEQTGTFTSTTFKTLINKFKTTK